MTNKAWSPRLQPALVVSVLWAMGTSRPAAAGGFEYPVQGLHALGRGGAFAVKADDPSAAYWNPAKLALLRGTRLMYNQNLADMTARYDRPPEKDSAGRWICFGTARERDGFFPLGISLFATSDFGLQDWTFALGVVGPSALGKASYGDDELAANRYSFTQMDILQMYYTASAAWKYKQWFGFGASLQYVDLPQLRYSLVIEGPESPGANPVSNTQDMLTRVEMSDRVGFSALLGAWARPWPFFEFAISARIVPIYIDAKGHAKFQGTSNSIFALKPADKVGASLHFQMPATVQVGARYIYSKDEKEIFDIELDFVWEQWSVLRNYDFRFDKHVINIGEASQITLQNFKLARHWQDTYSLRLGGQWNPLPDHLSIRAGGLWESAAQPEAYTMLDFASWDRLGFGLGLSAQWFGVELGLSYAHLFMLPRNVCSAAGRVYQQRLDPTFSGDMVAGPVVNAGHYEGSYDILALGLTLHFNEWFR